MSISTGTPGPTLDGVLGHHRRVVRGATGDDEHLVDLTQDLRVDGQLVEHDPARELDPAGKGVCDRVRLLEDLLEHEGVEATLLRSLEVPLHETLVERHAVAVQVGQDHLVRPDLDDAIVLHDHHVTGVLEEGGDVRSKEVLTLAPAHHQRRAASRPDQDIGLRFPHDDEGQCPVGLVHDTPHRVRQRKVGHLLDHVGDHLGVGVALELVAVLDELRLEIDPVLDDPVVDDHHVPVAVEMRVGIAGVWRAVCGPARVAYPGVGLGEILAIDQTLEVGDATGLLENGQRPAVVERNPGRVIPPIFEPGQTRHQDVDHRFRPDVSNDSAHIHSSLLLRCPECNGSQMRDAMHQEAGGCVRLTGGSLFRNRFRVLLPLLTT